MWVDWRPRCAGSALRTGRPARPPRPAPPPGAAPPATAAVAAGVVLTGALAAHAAGGGRVVYTVTSQWQGGFGASVNVTNLGDPVTSWRLTWSFPAGQTVTQLWNGTVTQSRAPGPRLTTAPGGGRRARGAPRAG